MDSSDLAPRDTQSTASVGYNGSVASAGDCEAHPWASPLRAARSRASLRLSKFAPGEFVDCGGRMPERTSAQPVARRVRPRMGRITGRVRPHLPLRQKRKRPRTGPFAFLAEREGFEPSVGYSPTPDFESGTFDHSATSPVGRMVAHASRESYASPSVVTTHRACGMLRRLAPIERP